VRTRSFGVVVLLGLSPLACQREPPARTAVAQPEKKREPLAVAVIDPWQPVDATFNGCEGG
jgi:hypothetical protein